MRDILKLSYLHWISISFPMYDFHIFLHCLFLALIGSSILLFKRLTVSIILCRHVNFISMLFEFCNVPLTIVPFLLHNCDNCSFKCSTHDTKRTPFHSTLQIPGNTKIQEKRRKMKNVCYQFKIAFK